ncbi:MAG: hypothetical protein CMM94_06440 [Rickettsiales bacterium]|nr:hypothetical protein [Rickettsiales bacterium]
MQLDEKTLTSSPEYKELVSKRSKLIWPLLSLTIIAYMGFILIIAFSPESLGKPVGDGVISIGLVLGLALIFFIFAITYVYVRKANREIEPLIRRIHELKGE